MSIENDHPDMTKPEDRRAALDAARVFLTEARSAAREMQLLHKRLCDGLEGLEVALSGVQTGDASAGFALELVRHHIRQTTQDYSRASQRFIRNWRPADSAIVDVMTGSPKPA